MPFPNQFLVNLEVHNDIVGNCFCELCREKRLERLQRVEYAEAYRQFTQMLPYDEDTKLDNYHGSVIKQVVFGEHYKKKAQAGPTSSRGQNGPFLC